MFAVSSIKPDVKEELPPGVVRNNKKLVQELVCGPVIFSDESCFSIFPTAGRVYVWKQLREANNPDFVLLIVKQKSGSAIVWTAISLNFLNPSVAVHDRINKTTTMQDDNSPIHTAHVDENLYEEHESVLEYIEWPQ